MSAARPESAIGVAAAAFGAVLLLLPGDARSIAAPAFACILAVAWLWLALSARNGEPPVVDIGMLCAAATLVYTVYPLVNYAVDGMQFGILADGRLRRYDIQPDELGRFHWRHVLYLSCFGVAYYLSGNRRAVGVVAVDLPGQSVVRSVVAVFACLTAYFLVLQFVFGVNYNTSYAEGAYDQNYAAMMALPLAVRQLSGKLLGILIVAKIALLCVVVGRAKDRKWLCILLAWGVFEAAQLVVVKGARSGFVIFVLAGVIYYNRMVRRLPLKAMALSAAGFFVFFIFMGLYRTYTSISDLGAEVLLSGTNPIATGNEFQSLFGTAYDVLNLKQGGVVIPWYLHINDFINLLPPQQLLPFEKVSASEWYLREIDLSGTGVGLMWGVVAQSIIGFDWAELALRGGILGFVLARFHDWYVDRRTGFVETVVYVYFCTRIYYTFRDTTFSLLANLVWEVVPFWLIVQALARLHDRNTLDCAA